VTQPVSRLSATRLAPRAILVAGISLLLVCHHAEQATGWKDTSPHRGQFVVVEPGVTLEVLDWGGAGIPLVFLSGLQDVAHGFDDFAPRFTDHFHVFAITRRGYGASSQTPSGYDLATRVADLRAVLDSLHLARVALVGHSIAGDELTAFAGAFPERVSHLVYLDAAYDHSGIGVLVREYPPLPPMVAADSADYFWRNAFGSDAVRSIRARWRRSRTIFVEWTPASSGNALRSSVVRASTVSPKRCNDLSGVRKRNAPL